MMIKDVLWNTENDKRVTTPTVLQMEGVECGAAALCIILGYFGKTVPLEKLRISCGVSRDGLKASNILKAAREYGLKANGFSKSIPKLQELEMPVIIFWNFNHFLVLEGFKKNKFYLSDPAQGRYSVTKEEFDDAFTGVVLVFSPTPTFTKGNDKIGLIPSLFSRIRNSRSSIIYIVLVSLFLVVPGLIIPSFTQVFIDKFLVNQVSGFVMPLLLVMTIALLLNAVLVSIQQYYLLRLETKLALATTSKFLWHVFHLPIAFFTQRYSSEIGSRVALNDKVAKLLSGDLANAFLNIIVVVFYALLLFSYDVPLTIIGIVMATINIVVLRFVSRARKDGNRRLINENGKLLGTTTSGISMIETLKASGRENDFFIKWSGYLAKVINAEQELGWLSARLNVVPPFLLSLTNTLILGIGAMRVMDGQMTLGMLVAFIYLMNNFLKPINQLVAVGTLLQETEGDMNRIDDVLNYEVSGEFIEPAAATESVEMTTQKRPNKLIGHLAIENLTFGYSSSMPALIENFSLHIRPGSRVALVGGSGSGKSTIAKLVAGLYEPWEGKILFDGASRKDTPREVLTESVAVIDQEVLIFKGTVGDNISFWDNKMPEKRIIKAAHDAEIHDVIASRADAYESEVAERGSNFSGGQRQRLEIARALTLNPSILILDEATSALDAKSEKLVMDNIRKRGCTCLIVAHRLSTIKDCDEIIVLKFGRIIERGTHQVLMEKNGLYAELISLK